MRDNYAYYKDLSAKTRALNALRNVFKVPVMERWLVSRSQGVDADSTIAKLIPHEYTYPKGTLRDAERDGFHYKLDLSNAVDHYVYFGIAEQGYANLFKHITPESRMIDVGANIGMLTLPFSRMASKGRVVSFEPDPTNHARLMEHLAMNRVKNVHVEKKGLGREEKRHKLYRVLETNAGMNRIILDDQGAAGFPYSEIHVVRLDDLYPTLGLDRLDVIKIDVEGFEMEVLRGAEATLRREKPVVFIELVDENLKENGSSGPELVSWLNGLGYTVHGAISLRTITPEQARGANLDLLCTMDR